MVPLENLKNRIQHRINTITPPDAIPPVLLVTHVDDLEFS
jgi:hypothetical protein